MLSGLLNTLYVLYYVTTDASYYSNKLLTVILNKVFMYTARGEIGILPPTLTFIPC